MAINELTLDEAATIKILDHRSNVRARLQNWKDVLDDSESVVYSAELTTTANMYLGKVFKAMEDDLAKYTAIDTELDDAYTGYAASDWKTDMTADRTALTLLKNWLDNVFNSNYAATDPDGIPLVKEVIASHKSQFSSQIATALG